MKQIGERVNDDRNDSACYMLVQMVMQTWLKLVILGISIEIFDSTHKIAKSLSGQTSDPYVCINPNMHRSLF